MLPISIRLLEEEKTLFDESSSYEEIAIPIEPVIENQTAFEFCVLQGPDKTKTWYRLANDLGLGKTEVKFVYSKSDSKYLSNEKLKVLLGKKELPSIGNLKDYFTDLWNDGKYWEILGVKEGSENFALACNVRTQILFRDEKEVHGLLHSAHEKVKDVMKTLGFVDVGLDFSTADVYLDETLKGKLPCSISIPQGKHVITIRHGQYALYSESVNISSGEKKKVTVQLSTLFKDQKSDQKGKINALEDKIRKLENDHKREMDSLKDENKDQREQNKRLENKVEALESTRADITPSNKSLLILFFLGFEMLASMLPSFSFMGIWPSEIGWALTPYYPYFDFVAGLAGWVFTFLFLFSLTAIIGIFQRKSWGPTMAFIVGIFASLWFLSTSPLWLLVANISLVSPEATWTLVFSLVIIVFSVVLGKLSIKERKRQG